MEKLIDIDRCHSLGKRKDNRPRAIIFKSNKFKDKQKKLRGIKKLKNIGIYINEDLIIQ